MSVCFSDSVTVELGSDESQTTGAYGWTGFHSTVIKVHCSCRLFYLVLLSVLDSNAYVVFIHTVINAITFSFSLVKCIFVPVDVESQIKL